MRLQDPAEEEVGLAADINGDLDVLQKLTDLLSKPIYATDTSTLRRSPVSPLYFRPASESVVLTLLGLTGGAPAGGNKLLTW